jgi:hypothetical protein
VEQTITTSIHVNAKLWLKVKLYAFKNNKKLKWCMEEGLRRLLEDDKESSA